MARGSIAVTLAGQEFRIRRDGEGPDPDWLQQVADHVDQTMDRIRERTGTVDTRDLALLTALNLAREVLSLREAMASGGDVARVRRLTERIEAALGASAPAAR